MKTIKNNKIKVINGTKITIKALECNTISSVKAFEHEAKISYKLNNGSLKELTIKENGTCSLYDLEAFIAHFFKHYNVGRCADETLTFVAGSIYRLAKDHSNRKDISTMIIENIRGFQLPTSSHLNRDEDFQSRNMQDHAAMIATLATFRH